MSRRELSGEDRLDAIYRLLALVFLCIGLVSGTGAVQFLVAAGSLAALLLSLVHQSLLAVAAVLFVFLLWRRLWPIAKSGSGCLLARDGFVFHSIQKAVGIATLATYASLALLGELSDDSALPARFYLNLAMAIMTLTFSLVYLVTSRVQVDDADTGLE